MKKAESKNTQKKKNKWLTPLLVSAGVVLAGAVAVGASYLALRGRETLNVNDSVYICVNGYRFDWPQGVSLIHNREGRTLLRAGGEEQSFEDMPLIQSNGAVLMQRSMIWNRREVEQLRRLDYFGKAEYANGQVRLVRGHDKAEGVDGFLYDGADTYVFLESVQLTWNNGEMSMTVPPLTVVQVRYRGDIQIYGSGVEPYYEELTAEEVTASFGDGKRINLATDKYYMPNGMWRLLFMPVEMLKSI